MTAKKNLAISHADGSFLHRTLTPKQPPLSPLCLFCQKEPDLDFFWWMYCKKISPLILQYLHRQIKLT